MKQHKKPQNPTALDRFSYPIVVEKIKNLESQTDLRRGTCYQLSELKKFQAWYQENFPDHC